MLGLAGGVGSGKSQVAELLRSRGATVVDADALGHRAIDEPEVRRRLVRAWGPIILKGNRIDRGSLAKVAFGSRASVRRLNGIVHPAILRHMRRRLALRRGWVVLDAALLYEVGADRLCDRVIFVDAPRWLRERRIRGRGWARGELKRRERFQWTVAYKKKKADYVLVNTGTLSDTERRLDKILHDLRRSI